MWKLENSRAGYLNGGYWARSRFKNLAKPLQLAAPDTDSMRRRYRVESL